jgi:UDP-3-O-[3-hydroxymyristoyl] glucosamine N-acyltransferase
LLRASLHEQEIRDVIGVPGDGELVVDGIATLDEVQDRCLCFVNREISVPIQESLSIRQGCIVITRQGSGLVALLGSCRVLETSQPRTAISRVLAFVRDGGRQLPWIPARKIAPGATVSPWSVVEGNVEIADGVVIEPFCTVGPDVAIGRGSILRSGVRVFPHVSIGEDSIIGANAVIGSQGFGFNRDEAGNKIRIPHLGGIVIGSRVEIGALSVVQHGTISPTIIEDGTKIDDNVEIAHNVHIGRRVSLVGGVVVGGSTVIQSDAWIGMNSTIRNGHRVGSRALVGMDASIQQDLADNAVARAPRPEVRMGLGKKLTP